jgi:hypothetical protein
MVLEIGNLPRTLYPLKEAIRVMEPSRSIGDGRMLGIPLKSWWLEEIAETLPSNVYGFRCNV